MSKVVLALANIPGVIRESVRAVLQSHGYVVSDSYAKHIDHWPTIGRERFEQLLAEIGNNAAQCLAGLDESPDDTHEYVATVGDGPEF